jgi:hypothetical protein
MYDVAAKKSTLGIQEIDVISGAKGHTHEKKIVSPLYNRH